MGPSSTIALETYLKCRVMRRTRYLKRIELFLETIDILVGEHFDGVTPHAFHYSIPYLCSSKTICTGRVDSGEWRRCDDDTGWNVGSRLIVGKLWCVDKWCGCWGPVLFSASARRGCQSSRCNVFNTLNKHPACCKDWFHGTVIRSEKMVFVNESKSGWTGKYRKLKRLKAPHPFYSPKNSFLNPLGNRRGDLDPKIPPYILAFLNNENSIQFQVCGISN